MIPVSTLYDDYIDRPKLTEQKKPFEYIVPPPPLKRGRNKKSMNSFFQRDYELSSTSIEDPYVGATQKKDKIIKEALR